MAARIRRIRPRIILAVAALLVLSGAGVLTLAAEGWRFGHPVGHTVYQPDQRPKRHRLGVRLHR